MRADVPGGLLSGDFDERSSKPFDEWDSTRNVADGFQLEAALTRSFVEETLGECARTPQEGDEEVEE